MLFSNKHCIRGYMDIFLIVMYIYEFYINRSFIYKYELFTLEVILSMIYLGREKLKCIYLIN